MITEYCVMCSEEITDPMCIKCYTKHVKEWMKEMGANASSIKVVSDAISRKFNKEWTNNEKCISCHKEEVHVCYYCFFYTVSKLLEKMNFPEGVMESFNRIFNYNFMVPEASYKKS